MITIFVGGSSNGRTAGFGPAYWGSNPCPPAKQHTQFLQLSDDTISLMKLFKNKVFITITLAIFTAFCAYQILYLRSAHSTFENYYAFRGCVQLLEKTPNYGTCKTNTGQVIKIVKFQNKWFLDGDLPCGFLCF